MKLSEIKGEKALDVIEAIAGPVASIVTDKQMKGMLDGKDVAKRADKVACFILKNHRADAVKILAALSLKEPDEYLSSVTLPKLLGDVYEVLTDEELLAFLPSAI